MSDSSLKAWADRTDLERALADAWMPARGGVGCKYCADREVSSPDRIDHAAFAELPHWDTCPVTLAKKLAAAESARAALIELFSPDNTTDLDGQCMTCWSDVGDTDRPEPHSTQCLIVQARALLASPAGGSPQTSDLIVKPTMVAAHSGGDQACPYRVLHSPAECWMTRELAEPEQTGQ